MTEERPPTDTPEERSASRRFLELADEVGELFDLWLFELDVFVQKTSSVIDVNPVVSLTYACSRPAAENRRPLHSTSQSFERAG